MGVFSGKKEQSWTVKTADGEHNIVLKMGASSREPMELFLDKRRIETIKFSGMSLIPNMEYNFACGEERMTLVLYGSKVDIVYKGMFLKKKIKYSPEDKLPMIYRIFTVLLAFSAVAEIYLFRLFTGPVPSNFAYVISLAMILSSAIIAYNSSTSPFLTKRKKFLFSLGGGLWAWIITFLVMTVFGNVDIWIK